MDEGELVGGGKGVDGGGIWDGIAGIREHLTPRPLTHLSLSLRLCSLSLHDLSLRESLEQVVHKGFEQSLYSKA